MPARTPRLDALIRTPGATRIPNPTLPILPPLGANGPPRRSPSSLGSQRLTQPASTPWARKSTHASECCSITSNYPEFRAARPRETPQIYDPFPDSVETSTPATLAAVRFGGQHGRRMPRRPNFNDRIDPLGLAEPAIASPTIRPPRIELAGRPACASAQAKRSRLCVVRTRISRLQPPLASGDQGSQRRCGRGGTASSPSAVGGRQWRGCAGATGPCRVATGFVEG